MIIAGAGLGGHVGVPVLMAIALVVTAVLLPSTPRAERATTLAWR